MSLEEALHANTVALNKLAELFSVLQIPTVSSDVSAQAAVAPSNTASSSPMSSCVLVTPSDDAAVPTAQAPVGEPVAADVTREQVAERITHLANEKGRDTAVAVLAGFGIKKLGEANPADYAAIMAACEAA